jgi:hypothetical protein
MKKPRVERSSEIWEYIDASRKVRVYRNLHKKCFSIKQDGLVACHADHVTLQGCKFIISKAGQKRVREQEQKNVHAFVEGYIVDTKAADLEVDGEVTDGQLMSGLTNWETLYYNPYDCDGFVNMYYPLTTATIDKRMIANTARFTDLYCDDTFFYGAGVVYGANV